MALFYVGYLIIVSSTVAFILAILTPRWIYPVDPTLIGSNSALVNDSSYRGIFYVDAGYPNGTCRDWILNNKDSIAPCRPSMTSIISPVSFRFDLIIILFSLCCRVCSTSNCWFISLDYSSLVSRWLSLCPSSTSCSSFCFSNCSIDPVDL